eukprot:jgi/Mesen1/9727/ME000695S09039
MADKPASGEIDEREEQGLLPPGALLSSSSDPQPPRQLSAAPILHGQIAQLDIRSDQSLTHLTRPYSEVEQSPRSPGQHADRASAAAASGTPAQRVEGFTGVEVPDAQQKPAPLYHPSGGIPSDSWPDKSRKMSELGNPARLEYEDRWQDTWASIVFCGTPWRSPPTQTHASSLLADSRLGLLLTHARLVLTHTLPLADSSPSGHPE